MPSIGQQSSPALETPICRQGPQYTVECKMWLYDGLQPSKQGDSRESYMNQISDAGRAGDEANKKDGYRQLNVRQLGSLRPWDHRSKCYMDRKRIPC